MKTVGSKHCSVDGQGLFHGRKAYTDDLSEQNSLIIKVLRSPHAHANILDIDTSKALEMDGVACVLTHKDFKRIAFTRAGQGYPEPSPHDKFILDSKVRYVGDEVAVVAGETEKIVDHALKAIKVSYEVLKPIIDFEEAKNNDSIIHDETDIHEMFPIGFEPEKNLAAAYDMSVGDVEEVLKQCDFTITETFFTHAQAHVMMEPHTANARLDYQGRLVIHSSTQTPFHVRRILSKGLEYPISKIRVIKPRVGGGFGGKQCIHGEFFVAAVTLRTKRPCKIVYSRKEVFESSYSRHPMRFKVTLGVDKDHTLKAIDVHLLSDTGAYGEHALTVFMVAGSKVLPLYNKVDAVRFTGDVVYTNKTPAGAYRGYGAIQGNFALESTIDILCEALREDPIAYRQRHMIAQGETSPIFEKMGEGTEGTAMNMDSCALDQCVIEGLEHIKWADKYPKQVLSSEKVKGVGMAIAMQGSGIPYIDMASATLKLNDDGFFNLIIGATDIGQGSDTVLAQIAAEALGVDLDRIIVYSSDTDLTPFDTGAYASSTTYVSGNAVYKTAKRMYDMILKEGARNLGFEIEQVTFDGKNIESLDGTKNISLADLATGLYYHDEQQQLMVTQSYVGTKSPPPFMAGFCEVDVDIETGEFEIVDYVAVVDCGTTINPNLAKGQVDGGILQGIGMAAYEEVHYNRGGGLITNNLMHYRIPTRQEVKSIRSFFVETYEPSGPYGAKSVGEIGIDTPPAALANAIYNATGVRIKTLPITPEKIRMGLLAKQKD